MAVDMTGTPWMQADAESDPANPSLGLATARDGTVVHLRLLRSLGVELSFRDGLVQGRQHLRRSSHHFLGVQAST